MSHNVRFVEGDLFSSTAQTLVNTVNCVGVMGAGLAKEFKRRWPLAYHLYREACGRRDVRIGCPLLVPMPGCPSRRILNFPTKEHWRRKSRLVYIELGLTAVVAHYAEWEIESIAFPQLGTDLGGLNWMDVRPLMMEYLEYLDVPVEIYIRNRGPGPDASDASSEMGGSQRPGSGQLLLPL